MKLHMKPDSVLIASENTWSFSCGSVTGLLLVHTFVLTMLTSHRCPLIIFKTGVDHYPSYSAGDQSRSLGVFAPRVWAFIDLTRTGRL